MTDDKLQKMQVSGQPEAVHISSKESNIHSRAVNKVETGDAYPIINAICFSYSVQ